jgi:coenzyme F420 hydrogenase subunit beta
MLQDGALIGRPGDDDPGAIALLRKLSRVSRKRWPEDSPVEAPRLMPPPKPKPDASAADKPAGEPAPASPA